MVAAAEEQRYEDGAGSVGGEAAQRLVEPGLVQLDVPEPHVQARTLGTDDVEQRGHGAAGAGIATAVGHEEEGGGGGAGRGGGADGVRSAGPVESDVPEAGAQLAGDAADELVGGVEEGRGVEGGCGIR
ncbi:hypothetical protein SMD44_02747 [Streptomyces alboflavus]|uniref:Uncharacterized protein n=1 Tax=Streptomyces alboflavus TaxID=67267 RepID=A0A1Z1WAB5_9ACTN|nr:hypothetical protein SMD44_02747 [Streptomyces alboflavus]